MMCAALICFGLLTITNANVERSQMGSCIETCSNNPAVSRSLGLRACPEGFKCRSNGCGHTCQKVAGNAHNNIIRRGACVEECDSGRYPDLNLSPCQEGYQCKSNGCGHTCQKVQGLLEKKDERSSFGACVIECDNGLYPDLKLLPCREGYECKSTGCGQICQKVDNHVEKKDERSDVGPCVISCDNGLYPDLNLMPCREGYECKSTGCGQTCQKVDTKIEREQHFGLCVEECNNNAVISRSLGLSSCPEGFECRSNGCGHTCQKVENHVEKKDERSDFGACVISCDNGLYPDLNLLPCREGYECKSTGCGQTCQKVDNKSIKNILRRGACVEECDSGLNSDLNLSPCQEGYQCKYNGCGHTCQKIEDKIETGQIGTCVDTCSNNAVSRSLGLGACPEGFECRSNGCGHTCQPVSN